MSESAAELVAGQDFAGWRVERELARGGMGVLYLAHHPRLPRTDVIKVLPPWLSSDTRFRERFLREVTRMSSLSHPHVMPIHARFVTEIPALRRDAEAVALRLLHILVRGG